MRVTSEMAEFYNNRTLRHRELVSKYCGKIAGADLGGFKELLDLADVHDMGKFYYPELVPYIHTTWKYKCLAEDIVYGLDEEMRLACDQATIHHIKCNPHHPDYFDMAPAQLNAADRDKPAEKVVDAHYMPDIYIAEMVADWCAMSEERGTDPWDWIGANVNVRWAFEPQQVELIHTLTRHAWDCPKDCTGRGPDADMCIDCT